MYMVVWSVGGRDLCQNRTWFRRRGADRRAAKLTRQAGANFRVEQVSFWARCAFWPTMFLYVLVPLLLVAPAVTTVALLLARR